MKDITERYSGKNKPALVPKFHWRCLLRVYTRFLIAFFTGLFLLFSPQFLLETPSQIFTELCHCIIASIYRMFYVSFPGVSSTRSFFEFVPKVPFESFSMFLLELLSGFLQNFYLNLCRSILRNFQQHISPYASTASCQIPSGDPSEDSKGPSASRDCVKIPTEFLSDIYYREFSGIWISTQDFLLRFSEFLIKDL